MLHFNFLIKNKFSDFSYDLFRILADNMSKIAPTGNTLENNYKIWFEAIENGLKKDQRKIILIYFHNELIGFFQYYTNNDLFMMEEIQIKPQYQGKENIFRELYGYVISNLSNQICLVEAYSNTKNRKSQAILRKMGLSIIGKNKNGDSYHFRGDYQSLLKWYNHA